MRLNNNDAMTAILALTGGIEVVLDKIPSFVHVLRGPELLICYANEAYYDLVGKRDLVGKTAFEAFPDIGQTEYPDTVREVMMTLRPFHGHALLLRLARHPDGPLEDRLIDLNYIPLIDSDGICRAVIGHGVDVTDNVLARRNAETTQRRIEERLRAALSAGQMASWEWDIESDKITSSPLMNALFGVPEDYVFPSSDVSFSFVHDDDRQRHRDLVESAIATLSPWHSEYRVKRPSGEVVWLEERAHASLDHTGHMTMVGLIWDITNRKSIEESLRAADVRKNDFLAMLAHELRNPLAPIRNGLRIMKQSKLGDEKFAALRNMMERQLMHLVHLVDDLLDINRITLGKFQLRGERVNLASLLTATLEANAHALESKSLGLYQDLDELAEVEGDHDRLAQVFSNIFANAVKFTPEGGSLWVKLEQSAEAAIVTVRDNGCGIDEADLNLVFDLFSQGPSHQTSGLGIGLALVRQLVELHGGLARVSSAGFNQGSTFEVTLPLSAATPLGTPEPPFINPITPSEPYSILVVDDNRDAADSLAISLEFEGHAVEVLYGGEAAIRSFVPEKHQVVILDIGMPDLDGYQVAKSLRSSHGRRVFLIALTGFGQQEDKIRAKEAGFDQHLTKPIDLDVLCALLRSRLQEPVAAHC